MPESISSNTSAPTGEALAATSWIARLTRESSPPEATFASGRSGRLACEETSNSISSAPMADGCSSEFSFTAKRPPAIASFCIAAVTALPSASAPARRFAESLRASGFIPVVRRRHFLAQRLRIDGELELRQAPLQLGGLRRQLLGPHAVLAGRRMQRFDARLGVAQRLRVELDARGVIAQVANRFTRLRFGRLEQLHHGFQSVIVRRKRLQPVRHRRQLAERGALGLRQGFERGLRTAEQARAVLQPGVLGGHLLPFALAQR